jgi:hypothetical protein
MGEIVASVRRVTPIIAAIATASSEQTDGIEHVNAAVARMEQDTQHNTRLVEETAGSAAELREQAASLAQVVSVFTLAREEARPPRAPRAQLSAPPAAQPAANSSQRRHRA